MRVARIAASGFVVEMAAPFLSAAMSDCPEQWVTVRSIYNPHILWWR